MRRPGSRRILSELRGSTAAPRARAMKRRICVVCISCRALKALSALALAMAVSGCGAGGSSPTAPSAPSEPEVVFQGSADLRPGSSGTASFITYRSGRLEVTVDWTFPGSDINISILSGTCTSRQFEEHTCSAVAQSILVTAKPERLTISNLSAGTYTARADQPRPGPRTCELPTRSLLTAAPQTGQLSHLRSRRLAMAGRSPRKLDPDGKVG